MTRITRPLAPLRASTREGGKQVSSPWIRSLLVAAGEPHIHRSSDRLRPVWLFGYPDAQSCSTTFSSMTTPSLAMSQFEQMLEEMPVDLSLALTSAYYLEVPLNGELFSSFSQAFHASLRTHHSATLSPVRSTSHYHIMSLVDIGLSIHTT